MAAPVKIPIAIVGLRFGRQIINKQLLHGAGAPYFEVAGICDLDADRAALVSAESGAKCHRDIDEVLADAGVRAVGLFTGPSGRAALIRKIIRAGKDVITTKPFELDPEAAVSIFEEARQLGRVIHLNSPAPVNPMDICKIMEWRAQYNLGEPIGCRADTWASYVEKSDGSWYDDPERCPVAPILRLGIYLINDLVAIFGKPKEVQVFASRFSTGRPTPDTAQLGIRFEKGGLANVFSSFCVKDGDSYRNSLVLNFQNGTVYRNCGERQCLQSSGSSNLFFSEKYASEMELVMEKEGRRFVAAKAKANPSGLYRWDLFHKAIRGEDIPEEITTDQLIDGLKIVKAMAEALRSGCTVRLD